MKKTVLSTLLLLLAFQLLIPFSVHAEVDPQIRYVSVENVTSETVTIMGPDGVQQVSVTHFEYHFALFRVDNWADWVWIKAWFNVDLSCSFKIGFNNVDPPRLQGIYPDYDTNIVTIITIMSEFPYRSETRIHPVDGVQKYYFYKMHFYIKEDAYKGETIRVSADFLEEPTFTGSELLVLKLKKPILVDGIVTYPFKLKRR